MKGISITKLKALQPKRVGRMAALLGAVSLVAGGMLLGGGVAHAVGTVPGALTLNPASGAIGTTPTYSTTVGCKAGFQGSAVVKEVHADGTTNNVTAVNASVVNPLSGTFQGSIAGVEGFAGANPGDTIELVVFCFSGPSTTGNSDPEQSTFLTFSADGNSYSTSGSAPVQPTSTTTLQVSPNPAQTGQTVTLTATVTISDSSAPNGTVTFSTGGSAIGSGPVTVGAGGVATMTTTFSTSGTISVTAAFAPAAGVHVTGSTSTPVSVSVIPAGGFFEPLSVTVPTSGTFTLTVGAGTVNLSVNSAGTTGTGQLFPITVSDTRNTFPGWSVSGQAADFLNNTSNPHGDISGNQLGWVPTDTQLTDATLGGTVNPAAPGLGTTAAVLASAASGHGVGTSVLSANLTLNIPVSSPAGAYSSNLTLTAVQSGA